LRLAACDAGWGSCTGGSTTIDDYGINRLDSDIMRVGLEVTYITPFGGRSKANHLLYLPHFNVIISESSQIGALGRNLDSHGFFIVAGSNRRQRDIWFIRRARRCRWLPLCGPLDEKEPNSMPSPL